MTDAVKKAAPRRSSHQLVVAHKSLAYPEAFETALDTEAVCERMALDPVHRPEDKIQRGGGQGLPEDVLGSREVVAAMDSKKIADYVRHAYAPHRILVAAAGNVDHDDFVRALHGALAILPAAPGPGPRTPPTSRSTRKVVQERPIEQVHMIIGADGRSISSPDRYSLLLLNVLLGGNMSSRLFQEIRERHGLAYSVFSFLSSYIDCGNLGIYLGVDQSQVNRSLALVQREIEKIVADRVAEDELVSAKEYAKGGLYLSAENMESRMIYLAQNELYFEREVTFEEVAAGLDSVSGSGIRKLARALFADGRFAGAVIGPVREEDIDWGLLNGHGADRD